MRITKGQLQAVSRRKDNIIVKSKAAKETNHGRQNNTCIKKLKIAQYVPHHQPGVKSCDADMEAVPVLLVAHVVLFLFEKKNLLKCHESGNKDSTAQHIKYHSVLHFVSNSTNFMYFRNCYINSKSHLRVRPLGF